MVVAAVAREVADAGAVLAALFRRQPHAEVDRVRDAKAQDPAVEIARRLGIGCVDAEMPQAQELERPRQAHASDIEFLVHPRGLRHAVPS